MSQPAQHSSPYRECLAAAFADMPAVLQQFHGATGDFVVTGRVTVTGAANPIARLVSWLMGAPTRDGEGPFTLERQLLAAQSAETWTRKFPAHRFHSTIHAENGLLIESMGPFSATSRVIWSAPTLRLELIGVRFFGIPPPAGCCHAWWRRSMRRRIDCTSTSTPMRPGSDGCLRTGALWRSIHDHRVRRAMPAVQWLGEISAAP
jgi:Domain of unknown function (DUF4166)